MKLAIQSTLLAALFFTVVLGTPVKGRPTALSESTTCSTKITCDECIAVKGASGSLCGYSRTNNACVELSPASPSSLKLVHTTVDCKLITSGQSSDSQPAPDAGPSKRTDTAQSNTKTHEGHKEKPSGGNPPVESRSNPNTRTPIVATAPTVHPLPPISVTCGGNTYNRANIQAAVSRGHTHIGNPFGGNCYPHEFHNREHLKLGTCTATPYYEFPILRTHRVYTVSDLPGADRVVFDPNGNYCAVITHTGAANSGFVSCT